MGMFGRKPLGATALPDGSAVATPHVSNSPFRQGGPGLKALGIISDGLLAFNGRDPIYGPAMAAQSKQQAELQQAMEIARLRQQAPEEPSIIRTARALGYDPASDQGRRFVTDASVAPRYVTLGSPETGQTVINPAALPPQEPPPQAVQQLRANPGSAAQFDEIFGAGASARYLGGM